MINLKIYILFYIDSESNFRNIDDNWSHRGLISC